MEKCKITRPQFLMKLFAGEITEEELKRVLPNHYKRVYGCYTMLKPYNFDDSDIIAATVDTDDGSITLQMRNKSIVSDIKDTCHKTTIFVGKTEFLVTVKTRGTFAVFNMITVEADEDE